MCCAVVDRILLGKVSELRVKVLCPKKQDIEVPPSEVHGGADDDDSKVHPSQFSLSSGAR